MASDHDDYYGLLNACARDEGGAEDDCLFGGTQGSRKVENCCPWWIVTFIPNQALRTMNSPLSFRRGLETPTAKWGTQMRLLELLPHADRAAEDERLCGAER